VQAKDFDPEILKTLDLPAPGEHVEFGNLVITPQFDMPLDGNEKNVVNLRGASSIIPIKGSIVLSSYIFLSKSKLKFFNRSENKTKNDLKLLK